MKGTEFAWAWFNSIAWFNSPNLPLQMETLFEVLHIMMFFLLLQWFLSLSCHTLSPVRLSIGCWNTVLISIGNQYLWRTLILNPERAQTSRAACCTCRQIERLASKCIYPAIHPTIHPPLDRLICNTECSIEFRHSEYEKFTQPSTQFTEGQFRPHTARTEHYAPPRPFNW